MPPERDFATALSEYAKALEIAPQEGAIWLSRSFAHAKLAEAFARAVEHFKAIHLQANTLGNPPAPGAEPSSQRSWEQVVVDSTRFLEQGDNQWWLWRAPPCAEGRTTE
jgi:hypothetical protein